MCRCGQSLGSFEFVYVQTEFGIVGWDRVSKCTCGQSFGSCEWANMWTEFWSCECLKVWTEFRIVLVCVGMERVWDRVSVCRCRQSLRSYEFVDVRTELVIVSVCVRVGRV
ncbi:hypothetical protein RRG08_040245 [Elysia crispata]|uniref:Uncharacterized protein n=1 Tax=Elysia crispata TaxID=231223 RepID=A0AAE0XYW8_9GAST|nr:hypothetical protein RRG08_040245 [Elysia crispata]